MGTHTFKFELVDNTLTLLVPEELVGKTVQVLITDDLNQISIKKNRKEKTSEPKSFDFQLLLENIFALNLTRRDDEDVLDELPKWFKEDTEMIKDLDIDKI
jgi:hypothetical protein